ncbi:hypothetical protein HYX10_05475 [Candidatus Woesearchaeota archaeon]|nr:hypothetical protein [Candidatus Woesearchaeota archaeon]
MKRIIFLCTVFILLLFAIGCSSQTPEKTSLPAKITPASEKEATPSNFLVYENDDYGIKIGYPPEWEQRETEEVITAFVSQKTGESDTLQENLGLTMNDLAGEGLALPGYNEIAIAQLKQVFPDIKIIESGSTVLSGMPAHKVVFTSSNLKFMQVWTIKNELAYVWTFASTENAFSDYLGTVQKMLDSFEITRNIRETEDEAVPIGEGAAPSVADADPAFVGSWRIFSERIFYDIGGAGAAAVPVTRNLELFKDGTWSFGDSQGTWTVTEITSDDWVRWDVNAYGPTRKIVLDNWNNAVADGPVEGSAYIDFIWVIYHVEPPLVQNPGTIWLKFGHS